MEPSLPVWVKLLLKEGLAYFIAVLATLVVWRVANFWIKVQTKRLQQALCQGDMCPWKRAVLEGAVTIQDIRRHPIWGFFDFSLGTKLHVLPIPEKGRKLIAQDFLRLKFLAVRDSFWTLVHQEDLDKLSDVELCNAILVAINGSVTRYESEASRMGIPPLVTDRFKIIHAPIVERLVDSIEANVMSEWHGDNLQKLAIVLDDLRSVLRRTISDCDRTFGTVNGELDGTVYRGVTVQPIPGHKAKSISGITNPGVIR